MPLTLEIPADEQLSSPDAPWDDSTAQAAADLIDRGEAEGEPIGDVLNAGMNGEQIADAITTDTTASLPEQNSNGKPAKKKRTRKAKAESNGDGKIEVEAEPAPAELDTPAVREQLAKVEISRSTRAMEISRVESDCLQCFMAIAEAEAVIESAKGTLKYQREIMAALAAELNQLRNGEAWQPKLPLSESLPAAAVEGTNGQDATDGPKPSAQCEATAPSVPLSCSTAAANGDAIPPIPFNFYPDAWRSASIDELGLTPKLTDSIRDTPTIGELADRISEINQQRAKWHKGVGAAKRTLVEDALNKWLNANRDSAAIKLEAQTQPAGSQSAISNGDDPTPSQSVESPCRPAAVSSHSSDADAKADAAIIARAKAIDDGSANCFARKHPDSPKYYESGYEAYGRLVDGEACKITDCPIVPGVEQDDWLRGFMAARAVDDYEPAATAAAESETAEAELVSIDDL